MADVLERLASQYNLFLCIECGKCVAACPMGKIFDDFSYEVSPRGVIERVLLDEIPEDSSTAAPVPALGSGQALCDIAALTTSHLWFCLTCDVCTNLCPAGVRFRDFVEAARLMVIELGVGEYGLFCRHCGTYLWPQHTVEYLTHKVGAGSEGFMTLCPRCRQYDFEEKVKALSPGSRKVCTKGERR